MFKYVLSAFICLAFAMPAAAQCGCDAAPACRTPKKLGFVPVNLKLPQITMKCTSDACGCSRRRLAIECVDATLSRPALVDREPCGGGLLQRAMGGLSNLGNRGGGCGCAAPAPAPAPCGCDAAPTFAEPAPEPIIYSDPVAAPAAADCGCNG